MKSKLIIKSTAAIGLLLGSAAAFAANGCCGDVACCLQSLICCF